MSSDQSGNPQAGAQEQARPLTGAEREAFNALKAELASRTATSNMEQGRTYYVEGQDPKTGQRVSVPTSHPSPATISNPTRRHAVCAQQQRDLARAFKAARRVAAMPVAPRRTPTPRPAARRPGARQTSRTSRGSPSGDDSDGEPARPSPWRGGATRHISSALARFLAERRPANAPPLIAYVRDPRYGLVNLRLAAVLRSLEGRP